MFYECFYDTFWLLLCTLLQVEHLFEDEMPDEPSQRRQKAQSVQIVYNEDNLPSFMKPTKAFEALVSVPVEEPAEQKPKRKSTVQIDANGEVKDMDDITH